MVSQPDHNETLDMTKSIKGEYELGGYAYIGSGHKISCIEVSLDGGVQRELARRNQTIMGCTGTGLGGCSTSG